MGEMTFTTIPINLIRLRIRLRYCNEDHVARLVESIREVGLINPITVRADKVPNDDGFYVPGYILVAGAHRLEAYKRLGYTEIPANVVDLPGLKRQLAEIDENLVGTILTTAERVLFTKMRKDYYEMLHPETRHGAIGGGHDQSRKVCDSAKVDRFTADTAARTGRSERAVQLDATRGEKIAEEVLDAVKGTDFVKGTDLDRGNKLDALAKLPVEQQQAVAAHVRNGDLISAKAAISPSTAVRTPTEGSLSTGETGDGMPANDARTIRKHLAALMAAWDQACPEARDRFRVKIGRSAFAKPRTGRVG